MLWPPNPTVATTAGIFGTLNSLRTSLIRLTRFFSYSAIDSSRAAVLVALPPDEAGDLVALALVAGHDLVDLVERLADAFDHELVFQRLPLAVGVGPAARRRAEIEAQRAVAHGGLDQQDLLVVEGAHDVAEAEFRADRLAVRGRAQRASLAVLRDAGFLEVDVVAHRPVALVVDQPRELAFPLGHRLEVAVAQQVHLLHPEPRRVALEAGDLERVALAGLEGHVLLDRLAARLPAVDLLSVEFHHVVGTLAGTAVHLIDALLGHLELALRDRLVGRRAVRQVDGQRRDLVVAHPLDLQGALGGRRVGSEVDPGVEVLGAAEVAHAHHVRLAGEDVDLDRLGGVARLAVRDRGARRGRSSPRREARGLPSSSQQGSGAGGVSCGVVECRCAPVRRPSRA